MCFIQDQLNLLHFHLLCKYFPPKGKKRKGISWVLFLRFILFTICQTCMILSSETEQITHGSVGFHEKSEIFAVCPPWINYKKAKPIKIYFRYQSISFTNNSGGPSSASSLVCSSPILLKSQTCNLRSVPLDASIVSLWCDHWTWNISSLWDSNVCNFNLRLRRSQSATV